MTVLVVSEGKNELGAIEDEESGALGVLVRRLLDRDITIEHRPIRDPNLKVHHKPGKGLSLTKRALAWIRYAQQRGCDALVLLVDEDGDATRQPALDAAQSEQRLTLPRAFGVAIRTFDAWMLADEQALSDVLGNVVPRQPEPERDRDPKASCEELRDASENSLSLTVLYLSLAKQLDIQRLSSRCGKGFAPFAERTRKL